MMSLHVAFFICVISTTFGYSVPETSMECPPNEHPTDCVNPCPTPVCSNPRPPNCKIKVCKKGCECDEGYVRTKKPDGFCIPIENCKNCLRPEFEYRQCGSKCFSTCPSPPGGKLCPFICQPGCFCAGGKVLNEKTNRCVAKSECNTIRSG